MTKYLSSRSASVPSGETYQKFGKLSTLRKKLLSGGAWALSMRILTVLTGLAVNVFLARLLSPEDLGSYFLLVSIVSVLTFISLGGTHLASVKLISQSIGQGDLGIIKPIIKKVFFLGGTGGILVAIITTIALNLFFSQNPKFEKLYQVQFFVFGWIILWTIQILIAESFRGLHDIRLAVTFRRFFPNLLVAVILCIFFLIQKRLAFSQVIVWVVMCWGISVLLSLTWLWQKVSKPIYNNQIKISAKSLWALSWPLWVSNVLSFALPLLDVWLISFFQPMSEVALYGAAARLVRFVGIPLLIVNAVVPPLIATIHSQGQTTLLERGLRDAATFACIPAMLVLLCFLVGAPWIMDLVYGNYYREGALILRILSIGFIARVFRGASVPTLMMTGNERLLMKMSVLFAFLMIIGSLILIQVYGSIGVAVMVSVTMILQSILYTYKVKRTVGVWTFPYLRPENLTKVFVKKI